MICPSPNTHAPNPTADPIAEAINETFRVFMAYPPPGYEKRIAFVPYTDRLPLSLSHGVARFSIVQSRGREEAGLTSDFVRRTISPFRRGEKIPKPYARPFLAATARTATALPAISQGRLGRLTGALSLS